MDLLSHRQLRLINQTRLQGLPKLPKDQLAVDLKHIVLKMGSQGYIFKATSLMEKTNFVINVFVACIASPCYYFTITTHLGMNGRSSYSKINYILVCFPFSVVGFLFFWELDRI